MKAKLLLYMMVLGLLTATAKQPTRKLIDGCVLLTSNSHDVQSKIMKSNEKAMKTHSIANKPKAGAITHQVNFVLDFNEESQTANTIYLRNTDYYLPYGYEGLVNGSNIFSVPEGTYDIIVEFMEGTKQLIVVRELVTISQDITLNISASEAKNHVEIQTINLDGEPFYADSYTLDNSEQWVLSEKGNCEKILYDNRLFCEDFGTMFTTLMVIGTPDDSFARNVSDWYISNLSSRWALYSYRVVTKGRDVFTSAYEIQGVSGDYTMTNDPSKYMLFEDPFLVTNYGNEELYQSFTMYPRIEKDWMIMALGWNIDIPIVKGETCKYYISASVEDSKMGIIPNLLPEVTTRTVTNYDGEEWVEYSEVMMGNPLTMSNNQVIFANNGIGYDGYGYYFPMFSNLYSEDYNEVFKWPDWPTHPVFSYSVEKKKGLLGNNCPILISNPHQWSETYSWDDENGNAISQTYHNMLYELGYVGRYAESKLDDVPNAGICVKLNGKEIIENQGSFAVQMEEPLNGIVDAIITNENVLVDDLVGSNKTQLHYTAGVEDENPPTMTMLHFKTTNDDVTDHLATADEGLLEFSAGDFNFIISPMGYQGYKTKPLESVEVSYSPYGEDNWNELAVEEVPENYWPVMGWFYTGSLAGVTGEGLNGWFDLKIRLTDAAGNWQEQVLSPAFRIDDHAYSSVVTIGSDNAREVARYNLAGQRVDASATGVVIIKMSDGTARKVMK